MAYKDLKISTQRAEFLANDIFGIKGQAVPLPGEIDFNFKIKTSNQLSYILKISRPNVDCTYLDFQIQLLKHLEQNTTDVPSPKVVDSLDKTPVPTFTDSHGNERVVRLLTWVPGRVWNCINPQTDSIRYSLGKQCGKLTTSLVEFDHPSAHRKFDWDIAQSLWSEKQLHLFQSHEKKVVVYFQQRFKERQDSYARLRKSVVHNDSNDNNIIVSEDLLNPMVKTVIDYGDAIHTQIINDLAVACAYGVMGQNDILSAALPIVSGYHASFPLRTEELEHLYDAIAMRLVISVTKSALNKIKEPDNKYLLISEQPAWDVLKKWYSTDADFAHYSFRKACGYVPHPAEKAFKKWVSNKTFVLSDLFPTLQRNQVHPLDLSISSHWLGHQEDFEDLPYFNYRIGRLLEQHPDCIPAGGYLEYRSIYNATEYDTMGNNGKASRTAHLGIDFWLPEETPVHTLMEGEVIVACNDSGYKKYGGLVILKHIAQDFEFFSLYGHLSNESILNLKVGQTLKKGRRIGLLGKDKENGGWSPHLHFQLMLSRLSKDKDFPGVALHAELDTWKSICPDPNELFRLEGLCPSKTSTDDELVKKRQCHLGKGLSLNYNEPLKMVRGSGQYLMDKYGRKYLDTVNNVAHVGHEHPSVVKAGQEQMALINTNTRYLHDNILELTEELLETLPPELSVLHFVNSGSEANELAIRMVKTFTGEHDIIASEVGYHGNSNMCVDISSYKFDGKGGHGAPEHTHIFPLPDTFRGKYRGNGTEGDYVKEIKKLIERIQHKERGVGALILEPIISCGGQIELPHGFLPQAYELIRNAGGLCISDEVQVGCGRVGKTFWGFELYNVIPDIVTIGKPLGNGHPLAAVACTPAVAEKFANGMEYFNTFGGNPVSCAIGTEVLRTIKREKLQENALKVGNFLKHRLKKLATGFPIIGDVRGQGFFLGIELVDSELNPLPAQSDYLINRMKDHGILMSTDGPDQNVLKIKPPMVFTQENGEELIFYLEKILQEDVMKEY